MSNVFLLLLFATIAGVVLYVSYAMAQRRREALSGAAHRLGLAFDPGSDSSLHRRFEHGLFKKGRSRRGYNTMSGMISLAGYRVRVVMGDYRYTTGSGKNSHTHRVSYATFQLPFLRTPDLLVKKEGIGDKLVGGLGFDDIDFESEEFSRAFWVKSSDKRFAYDVIHPRMMEFLMKGPTPRIEIVHDVCLIQEGLGRWDADTFEGAPRWFEAFLELWPEHLTRELTTRYGDFE